MSAQFTTIFPSEITLPKTIIAALDGSSSMYIENPWFPKPLGSMTYNEDVAKPRVFTDASGKVKTMFGTHFHAPRLLMRSGTEGPFTTQFTIRYGDANKSLKSVMVKKPWLQNGEADTSKWKVSLTVSPRAIDRTTGYGQEEDEIMLRLDQIYSMVLEFVMIAINAKFDGFDHKDDDKTLISKLCAHIGAPKGEEELNNEYYTYFERPPVWDKSSDGVFYIQSLNPRKQFTLMNLVKGFIQDNERAIKINPVIKKVIKEKRCSIIPCFKRYRYETKKKNESGEPIQAVTIEAPLRFHLQIPGVTPHNFPSILFTKTPRRAQRSHIMDFDELQSFYGVVNGDYSKAKWASFYDAAVILGTCTEYAIYAQGQPKTQWYVETLLYKRLMSASATQSAFEDDIFDAIEEDMEVAPVKTVSMDIQQSQLDELLDSTSE